MIPFSGTFVNVKFPSKSVMTPFVVPLTTILTPIMDSPEASTIVPETVLV